MRFSFQHFLFFALMTLNLQHFFFILPHIISLFYFSKSLIILSIFKFDYIHG